MSNLDDLRKQIDDIDAAIIELLAQRMEVCRDVATLKASSRGGAMPEGLLALGEQLSRVAGRLATAQDLEIRLVGGERLVVVPGRGAAALVLLEAWRPAAEVREEVHALLQEGV